MANYRLPGFNETYRVLDKSVKKQYRRAYKEYEKNPRSVKLEAKGRMSDGTQVCGVRVDANWRALAYKEDGDYLWFWAGLHTDYDRILKGLSLTK